MVDSMNPAMSLAVSRAAQAANGNATVRGSSFVPEKKPLAQERRSDPANDHDA
jgi:hypothetical protein